MHGRTKSRVAVYFVACCGVGALGLSVGSFWMCGGVSWGFYLLYAYRGAIVFDFRPPLDWPGTSRPGAFLYRQEPYSWVDIGAATYVPTYKRWRVYGRATMPLWIPPFASCAALALMYRRRSRRKLLGHCAACGYDLTGNVSGICSECGRPIEWGAAEGGGSLGARRPGT